MDTPSSSRFTGTLQGRDSDTLNNIADQTFSGRVPHGINFTQPRLKDVKRGHVYGIKELHNDDIHEYDWEWHEDDNFILGKHKARRTICTAKLPMLSRCNEDRFTIIEYEGEDALRIWEGDLKTHTLCDEHSNLFQLFRVNQSKVPMLIFHHELIPLRHIVDDDSQKFSSILQELYFKYLTVQLGSYHRIWTLWMNMKRGVFCVGPEIYPSGPLTVPDKPSYDVPPTLDMLHDKTSIRFFTGKVPSRFGVESLLLKIAVGRENTSRIQLSEDMTIDMPEYDLDWYCNHLEWPWQNRLCRLPEEIASLRLDTVYSRSRGAVAIWPEEYQLPCWEFSGMVSKEVRNHGTLTRFQLEPNPDEPWISITYDANSALLNAWLSQFPRICDTLGTNEERENFVIMRVHADFYANIEMTRNPAFLDETAPPIFLFVCTPPMAIGKFASWVKGSPSFWSFDESGRTRMSEDECECWALPVLYPNEGNAQVISWTGHVYRSLRAWQVARGFDLGSSDWARELGYPELEIVGSTEEESRFEVLDVPVFSWYGKKFKEGLKRLWRSK